MALVRLIWGVATAIITGVWLLTAMGAMWSDQPVVTLAAATTFSGPIGVTVAVYVIARGLDRIVSAGRLPGD